MAKKEKGIRDELLDELIAGQDPRELFTRDGLFDQLKKGLMDRMLEAEMTRHLGYESGEEKPENQENQRNGHSSKKVIAGESKIELQIPRDRQGTFDPVLVGKFQRRLPGFDDRVIGLYARGMTVREIQGFIEEHYKTAVSPDLISEITDTVIDEIKLWQGRALETIYPLVIFDALWVKIRDEGQVKNKAIYLAMGVTVDGNKDILGLWIEQTEGAKFWLKVMTELKNRGLQDILIAVVDGLKGFPEAINAVYPQTQVQSCVVHLMRNSLNFVGWQDRKQVAAALKEIYQAETAEAAHERLREFGQSEWGKKYPTIVPMWERVWEHVSVFLGYPREVRTMIYTTNALESVNMRVRKIIKTRGHFPSDEAATKLIYLALRNIGGCQADETKRRQSLVKSDVRMSPGV
jgi:putative transposase